MLVTNVKNSKCIAISYTFNCVIAMLTLMSYSSNFLLVISNYSRNNVRKKKCEFEMEDERIKEFY